MAGVHKLYSKVGKKKVGRKNSAGTAGFHSHAYVYLTSTTLKLCRRSVADSNHRDSVELLLKLVFQSKGLSCMNNEAKQ